MFVDKATHIIEFWKCLPGTNTNLIKDIINCGFEKSYNIGPWQEPTQQRLNGASFGKAPIFLLSKIRLGLKELPETNTVAYFVSVADGWS